ncbi:restriction endonuclease subunit S [Pseudoalteromonas fuliginea]|uniref:Restriction endonuclease subunit S n=1 Tax=Pseudoalteromonas fuliginea TaxID=1872678 RepID=A0ABQ6RIA5_9GAMM|nr:restriction endonuclease subunit S [Pseudoalteromonas fuliginea]KAA1156614.1 restriction endonuclease subunit S [Pseudoalteromonas fuliginea]KAA1167443.1 restriction endonuclease subunit S [Pseudoalteromonas fuliginea]
MSELKAGKYQAYSKYRDSGVEWLDKIPSNWKNAPIKYMALSKKSLFLDGNWIESKDISEEGIRYITTGNIGEGSYKEQGMGFITQETFNKLNCTEVYVGDILISRLNNPIGRACILPDLNNRVVTSVDNVIFRPDSTYDKRFLVYLFSSKDYFKHTSNLARGATMQRISRGLLGNIRAVFPIKEEQTQIANFLDHETAKIDTLIDKQQQLIKLLKEKRQAVISHAVTKGIPNKKHPQAPMKDSGVKWLGEVPEHWVVTKLKYLSSIQGGYAFSSDSFTEEGVQILRIGNVYQNRLALERQPIFVPHKMLNELSDFKVQQNDILMSLTGTLGKRDYGFAIKVEHCDSFLLNQRVAKLLPFDAKVDLDFLINVLWSESYLTQLYSLPSGTKQANLANSDVLGIVVAIPPTKEEQRAIANYLSQKLEYFDRTIEKAQNAILLMHERRTALISAAVTGKIDVRNRDQPND